MKTPQIIKDFLKATPMWLEALKRQEQFLIKDNEKCAIVTKTGCTFCGARYDSIKELYEELNKIFGE